MIIFIPGAYSVGKYIHDHIIPGAYSVGKYILIQVVKDLAVYVNIMKCLTFGYSLYFVATRTTYQTYSFKHFVPSFVT